MVITEDSSNGLFSNSTEDMAVATYTVNGEETGEVDMAAVAYTVKNNSHADEKEDRGRSTMRNGLPTRSIAHMVRLVVLIRTHCVS